MGGIEDRLRHPPVEDQAAPHEEARAQHLQGGVDAEPEDRDQGDAQERGLVPARQHAIVDLQHVERADEQQKVDEEPEGDRRRQDGPHRTQAVAQHRPRRLRVHAALCILARAQATRDLSVPGDPESEFFIRR
jgi:hypothetical protein